VTTASELIRSMQEQAARHFAGSEITILEIGVSAFSDDGAVTYGDREELTVACSHPREYQAEDGGDAALNGTTFVLIDRSDSRLEFDPQPGMIAEIGGEQYRIVKARYLPGAIRLHLSGAGAEGAESS